MPIAVLLVLLAVVLPADPAASVTWLDELDLRHTLCGWGRPQPRRSVGGEPLTVAGERHDRGVGSHAPGRMRYLLDGRCRGFTARVGIDDEVSSTQRGHDTASVAFEVHADGETLWSSGVMRAGEPLREVAVDLAGRREVVLVMTDGGDGYGWDHADWIDARFEHDGEPPRAPTGDERFELAIGGLSPERSAAALRVKDGLAATLFASEPMLFSPSAIEVDARGRVWVCEVINYRGHEGARPEGDRILILSDRDGDGRADERRVFAQDPSIDSPHGLCVLDDRVLVSAGEHVLSFVDEDGDDHADRVETLFSGISGRQHDHGIHAFHFGPDGRLYFNFGNEAKQLRTGTGEPVIDVAGNVVASNLAPYQEGMVFRCELDGSRVDTVAWNFRNNWEVAVDAYGGIWQSDNDDDGNRGVRINFVMEYGNYGFRDEITGAAWSEPRVGMHPDRRLRHWHQNDPGVVPNLLPTDAGSPTGIVVYEGDLLPPGLRGCLIHADAGPGVVRAYPVRPEGAGYAAHIEDIVTSDDPWFRPSDVAVAPDGSLFVADWYDPGVGGHRAQDLGGGRIYRIAPAGAPYRPVAPDAASDAVEEVVAGLFSPNEATRYLAWQRTATAGDAAIEALRAAASSGLSSRRARALWRLGTLPGRAGEAIDLALAAAEPDLRVIGLRLARRLDRRVIDVVRALIDDASPMVWRECAIALRHVPAPEAAPLWVSLARRHDGEDRWYLEALGIGAALHWNECFDAWITAVGDWNTVAGRDLVWRARATRALPLIAELLCDPSLPVPEVARFLRAFDFHPAGDVRAAALEQVVRFGLDERSLAEDGRELRVVEGLLRLADESTAGRPGVRELLDRFLLEHGVGGRGMEVVERFGVEARASDLLSVAIGADLGEGVRALRRLFDSGRHAAVQDWLGEASDAHAATLLARLAYLASPEAVAIARSDLLASSPGSARVAASIEALAGSPGGRAALLQVLVDGRFAGASFESARSALLRNAVEPEVRSAAMDLARDVVEPSGADPAALLTGLARGDGDAAIGAAAFDRLCASCHAIDGRGAAFGPDLSGIGSKLAGEALIEAILAPSAAISVGYVASRVVTRDGGTSLGIVRTRTPLRLTLAMPGGVALDFSTYDVRSVDELDVSIMPELRNSMSDVELRGLLRYLTERHASASSPPVDSPVSSSTASAAPGVVGVVCAISASVLLVIAAAIWLATRRPDGV